VAPKMWNLESTFCMWVKPGADNGLRGSFRLVRYVFVKFDKSILYSKNQFL
jgi:hypothetical protein